MSKKESTKVKTKVKTKEEPVTIKKVKKASAADADAAKKEAFRERMAASRAKGATATKGKAGDKKARYTPPLFDAPEDFKPHFVSIMLKTEKDGLLSNAIRATRYVGRDPVDEIDDKKKHDVGSYDQATVQGILSRFSMTTFATNPLKRFEQNTVFRILLRVNRKSKDGSISVIFKGMEHAVKSKKTGRMKWVALEKSDPTYRKFRKATRILPAAFKEVLMPPARVRGSKVKKGDEVDDE